ncbi:uncharacterized protein LOC129776235 [Toxorhynchites rutilus septentrionalis]|uniref:uncharacterized protein LOC129776235 n=1 Tax=Toxorhynchites rutilus septentrionalis TaxID=329112 RepID=UPI0024796E1F|nr:uncharacterized protein LOC129776235 [Toxorhynchites rutilus septentrionalis]
MGVNDTGNESELTSSTSKMNLEMLQKIFLKIEPDVIIDSYEESKGADRGDNYTAALFRLTLKGHTPSSDGSKKLRWEKTVICKRLPDCKVKREAFKSETLFRNEVEFYNTIMPEFLAFQKRKSGSGNASEIFTAVPQCYLAQDDLVILEDLRVRRFSMPNRQRGLGMEQMKVTLVELAKYHAVSLAYREQHPTEFKKLISKISEGIFAKANTEWYKNYYGILTKNAIQMVTQTVPGKAEYADKLKAFVKNFFGNMVDLVNKDTKLSVICHGDCWTNNILYKYDDKGSICETYFVDFQMIRYGSFALDLSYMIYCCTDASLRKTNLQNWLKIYHQQLVKSLKLLGSLEDLCTDEEDLLQQIKDEFKECARFGLGTAMDMLPISTCSSEEAPDLYVSASEGVPAPPELNVPTNEDCRRKMTDIVMELVDGEML